MNPINAQSTIDRNAIEAAISAHRGTLTKDDTVDVLLDYVQTLQYDARHAMVSACETEDGCMTFIGGSFELLYIMINCLHKKLRKRVGFWKMLYGTMTLRRKAQEVATGD